MLSAFNSSLELADHCSFPSVLTMIGTLMVIYSLLLPLFLGVLYMGYTLKKPSHSDVFTFHIITMEILTTLGTYWYFFGGIHKLLLLQKAGSVAYCVGITGQMFVHALTCVERYMAVVHPIVYMRLKERGGVIVRNVSIAAVWLLSFGSICLMFVHGIMPNYVNVSMLTTACCVIAVVGFCSVSVLYVLKRPGPGEGGLRHIDKTKRRALTTIIAIVSVLVLRFIFLIVMYFFSLVGNLSLHDTCLLASSAGCFTFPSSLVLPLLFLQRVGKLQKACAWCRSVRGSVCVW